MDVDKQSFFNFLAGNLFNSVVGVASIVVSVFLFALQFWPARELELQKVIETPLAKAALAGAPAGEAFTAFTFELKNPRDANFENNIDITVNCDCALEAAWTSFGGGVLDLPDKTAAARLGPLQSPSLRFERLRNNDWRINDVLVSSNASGWLTVLVRGNPQSVAIKAPIVTPVFPNWLPETLTILLIALLLVMLVRNERRLAKAEMELANRCDTLNTQITVGAKTSAQALTAAVATLTDRCETHEELVARQHSEIDMAIAASADKTSRALDDKEKAIDHRCAAVEHQLIEHRFEHSRNILNLSAKIKEIKALHHSEREREVRRRTDAVATPPGVEKRRYAPAFDSVFPAADERLARRPPRTYIPPPSNPEPDGNVDQVQH